MANYTIKPGCEINTGKRKYKAGDTVTEVMLPNIADFVKQGVAVLVTPAVPPKTTTPKE